MPSFRKALWDAYQGPKYYQASWDKDGTDFALKLIADPIEGKEEDGK